MVTVQSQARTSASCSFTANASNYSGGALFLSGGSNPGRVNLQSTRICGNASPIGPQIGMNAGGVVTDLGGVCISNNCDDCAVAPPCTADLNGDRAVTGEDLGLLLGAWGGSGRGDLNGDGAVNGADLGTMLGAWGACQ